MLDEIRHPAKKATAKKKAVNKPDKQQLLQTKSSENLTVGVNNLIAEACSFAKSNNDDPNDHTIDNSCGDGSK